MYGLNGLITFSINLLEFKQSHTLEKQHLHYKEQQKAKLK